MSNSIIRKKWEQFITEYQEYFISNEEKWKKNLELVKKYIYQNKQLPTIYDKNKDTNILGNWLNIQKQNYKIKERIMKKKNIRLIWEEFNDKYKKFLLSYEEQWEQYLEQVKKYIDENKKSPSQHDKNTNIKHLGRWLTSQKTNFKTHKGTVANKEIRKKWEQFTTEYEEYFISNEEKWKQQLELVKKYIDENKQRPSKHNKNKDIKQLGRWLSMQINNYKKKIQIMSNKEIREKWEQFITDYQEYFPDNPAIKLSNPTPKSTKIELAKKSTIKQAKTSKQNSIYQKIGKKMSIQHSKNTVDMFKKTPNEWHIYHDNRDESFKGYDNQEEIPVNKIIKYLETKMKHKLKILDLGCGRNKIKEHFKNNKKFKITGYDYVKFNGSKVGDISDLSNYEDEETIDICIFSQSLMGSNWKEYIKEALKVLRHNGEIIISESTDRYEKIKEYLNELGFFIKKDNYKKDNRWFIINGIKD